MCLSPVLSHVLNGCNINSQEYHVGETRSAKKWLYKKHKKSRVSCPKWEWGARQSSCFPARQSVKNPLGSNIEEPITSANAPHYTEGSIMLSPGSEILKMRAFCLFFLHNLAFIYFSVQEYLSQDSEKEINQFCSLSKSCYHRGI